MRGFVKIPRSIMEEPWSRDANTLYLYTWLSMNADKNGQIRTSRADLSERTGLSERQIRTSLEKLIATKYATKLATKLPTKFATILTVCYLASYNVEKNASDQVNDQVNDQVSDQVAKEKEKKQKKIENIYNNIYNNNKPPTHTNVCVVPQGDTRENTPYGKFLKWLKDNCPYIATHYKLPKESEFAKIYEQYGGMAIAVECENIENRVDLRKRYSNLYRTLLNWLKRNDSKRNNPTVNSPTNDDVREQSIGIMQRLRAERKNGSYT
jgi:hypothetical protein